VKDVQRHVSSRAIASVILPAAAALVMWVGAAWAEVPTPADMAACNEKAKSEVDGISASPRTESERKPGDLARRADPVRQEAPPINRDSPFPAPGGKTTDPTGRTITGTADPQLEGMDAERANDPAYVAAYKSCMRQGGF